mgnify:CR=1 FL=1
MVKFGALYLNKGNWNGKQIIPQYWVERSTSTYGDNFGINIPEEPSGKQGYSYSWWIKTYKKKGKRIKMFSAGGWGGQHIMVIPELNTVIVFTGGNYTTYRPPFKILKKYILPALNQ